MNESKIILITGGAGFIGSHFIKFVNQKYPDYKIINFDKLTYAGNLNNLIVMEENQNYTFVKGDIANEKEVENVFEQFSPDFVVNFAAESHVDKSIALPNLFLQTNVIGTQNLLNNAREHEVTKFIQISTDEVYGSVFLDTKCKEDCILAPSNPYSASKSAADHLVCVAQRTFKQNVNIIRSSNIYGPNQFPEKFIPLIVNNALNGINVPIYGEGRNIRNWLFVDDYCVVVDKILHSGKSGEIYNVSGEDFMENIQLAKQILKIMSITEDIIEHVMDRKGHDYCYSINSDKFRSEFNWKPQTSFLEGLQKTISWYQNHSEWLAEIQSGEYLEYNKKILINKMMESDE